MCSLCPDLADTHEVFIIFGNVRLNLPWLEDLCLILHMSTAIRGVRLFWTDGLRMESVEA